MTELLKTPAGWPTILLGRANAKDPTDLDAAVAAGTFSGLRRAIRDLGPTAVIAHIAQSGLRGRGGAVIVHGLRLLAGGSRLEAQVGVEARRPVDVRVPGARLVADPLDGGDR